MQRPAGPHSRVCRQNQCPSGWAQDGHRMGSEASSVGRGAARGTSRSEESPTGTGAQCEGDTVLEQHLCRAQVWRGHLRRGSGGKAKN